MAGSHRNEEAPATMPHRVPLVVIGLGLALLAAFLIWTLVSDGPDEPGSHTGSATSPTPTPTQQHTPKPADVAPIDDLPQIAAAAPERLVIEGVVAAGFDKAVATGDGPLEATSAEDLVWVAERGEPGSPGEDAVVVVGQDRFDRQAALNDIADVDKGDKIRVTTAKARLVYTVDSIFHVVSATFTDSSTYAAERPARLLLVATTYSEAGVRTGSDTVVIAHLTGAEAR